MKKQRYTTSKMTSGYNGVSRYYVYDTVSKGRVTVHAHLMRSTAELQADQLNISDMVKPYDEDPRPYEVRLAEATEAYSKK